MRIAIIGDNEGGTSLAQWGGQAGHQVAMGAPGTGHEVDQAAAFGEVVLFSPEWADAQAVLDAAGAALAGKPVLDATNPVVPGRFSGIEALSLQAPQAHWVKAFNTCSADVLQRR